MRQTWWTRPAFLVGLALIPLVGWLVLAVLPWGVVVGALRTALDDLAARLTAAGAQVGPIVCADRDHPSITIE